MSFGPVSQPPANQPPPSAPGPENNAGPAASPPSVGSWPPVAPPVVNRLASAATAAPFVPEPKKQEKSGLDFSCIVEPPPKRVRAVSPTSATEEPAPRSGNSTPPQPVPAAPRSGMIPVSGGTNAPMAPATAIPAPKAAVAATTVAPFASGGTTAPFSPAGTQQPFEFQAPEPPKVKWFGWGTALLVAGCAAGYLQFQRMERERIESSRADVAQAAADAARIKIGDDPGPAGAPPKGTTLDLAASTAPSTANAATASAANRAGNASTSTAPAATPGIAPTKPTDAKAGPAKAGEGKSGDGLLFGMPTPFTALKQAKAMINDADQKRKAAYGTVEAMLDDPTGSAALPGEPAPEVKKPAPKAVLVGPAQTGLPVGARLADIKGDLIVVDESKATPSASFIAWARTVKIGGARPGAAARVLIGNASFGIDDEVDAQRGIVFLGYDEASRLVRFRETATGAELSLKK